MYWALRRAGRKLPLPVKVALKNLWLRTRPPEPLPDRLRQYAEPQRPGLLSFISTVWNTDPVYLDALAETVFGQEGGTNFEWLILDNGSHREDTRATLARMAQHPCVRLERAEANLGIIGGMRFCLERATGRYILPLDSDDVLSLDCVTIFTTLIVENDFPALLYSDEDKLLGQIRSQPYYKPDWDPVLFMHSCYIAHLCAIDRELALAYGAYSDKRPEGSHDWDSFTRFHLHGHRPVHVPEIVYSWRMHPQSTSSNIGSKPFVVDSQRAVLERFLSGAARPDLYRVEKSPLFPGTPDWQICRAHVDAPPLTTLLLTDTPGTAPPVVPDAGYPGHQVVPVPLAGGLAALAAAVAGLDGLVHLQRADIMLQGDDWAWEALTLLELFPDTVMVGGRVLDTRGRVLAADALFGFGRGCDCPDRGRMAEDPGYFATLWKPHSTSAVSSQHTVFRAAFLADLLHGLLAAGEASVENLGAWAGALARRQGGRVIYSPFLLGEVAVDWDARISERERAAFLRANADLIPEQLYYSRHYGFNRAAPHGRAGPVTREAHRRQLLQWAAQLETA